MQKINRQKMQEQDPIIRSKNFEEVALGFTKEEAILEAKRCLQCKNPLCQQGCPVNIEIPLFISKIANGEFEEAYNIIKQKNSLPCITGRVCPQETQCESECILGIKGEPIAIGDLERFVSDLARENNLNVIPNEQSKEESLKNNPADNCEAIIRHSTSSCHSELVSESISGSKKVAIFGSGPAGLACAGECAKLGYAVTVFEPLHALGGVLRYGIPEFRLPNEILDYEIEYLKDLGVKFELNVFVGFTVTIQDLKDRGFKAFFVATGAGVPFFIGIPNENLLGIHTANEFLTRVNLMTAYRFPKFHTPINTGEKALVIGGGNVAMDSARTLLRLGYKKVVIVYRRTKNELPARKIEIHHAEEEGIIFKFLTSPVEFINDGTGHTKGLKVQKMELTNELDSKGRKKPKPIDKAFEVIEADTAIIAVGQNSNPILAIKLGVELDKHNHIVVTENMQTSVPDIFAGGDITTGAATVISAMGAGKIAAKAINEYLKKNKRFIN